MNITPMIPTQAAAPVAAAASTGTTNGLPSGQSLNNMFLQLLVAQLQNQDPTSPVDPSQFIGQLAQFSELSEVTSIYQLLQQVVPAAVGGSGSSGGASPVGGGSANGAAVVPTATSALAPASSAVPATAVPQPNFLSPNLSAITSKIQGAF